MKKLILLLILGMMLVSCVTIREAQIPKGEYYGVVECCPILSAAQPSTGEGKTYDELLRCAEFVSAGVGM